MSIIFEHVHRLELQKYFKFCVAVASVPKTPFMSYSCISDFGHACFKLYFVLIKCATQNLQKK